MIDIYVICLDKMKKTRGIPTLKTLNHLNHKKYNIIPFKAITPEDFNINSDIIHPAIKTNIKDNHTIHSDLLYKNNHVACALSHIELWKKCVITNKPIIISEDDNILSRKKINKIMSHLDNIPEDTDIFCLRNMAFGVKYYSKKRYINKLKHFNGLQLYYITPKCCKKLLKHVFPLIYHVDSYISHCIPSMNLNVYSSKDSHIPQLIYIKDFMKSTLSHDVLNSDNYVNNLQKMIYVIIIIIMIIFICLCKLV